MADLTPPPPSLKGRGGLNHSRAFQEWANGETATGRRERWLYLANARVPSEKAHVYQIFQMVDALQDAGVDVDLAFPARANLPGVADQDPVVLYGLRHRPRLWALRSVDAVKLVTIDRPRLNRAPFPALAFGLQTLTFACRAAWVARRSGAAVVYGRDWPVLAAALASGKPVFWEAHDLPQGKVARAALGRLVPRLAGIVAISHGLRDEIGKSGVPDERLLVAPDAVDLKRFADAPGRDAARAALGITIDGKIVVYTGHLYHWKGAHTLALAARDLPPDTQVCIVGGTPADLRAFRAFVEEQRLDRVRVAGHVPPSEVPVWLAAADVLALPNSGKEQISSRYTSPLKLFEYMAAGRPIVASDLPSLREVLAPDVNAVLVRPDDPSALAAGIADLLGDPVKGARLAETARRDVQGCTWDARAKEIVQFVHAVAAQRDGES